MKGYSLSVLTNQCVTFDGTPEFRDKCYNSLYDRDGRTYCFICKGGYPINGFSECQDFNSSSSNWENCEYGMSYVTSSGDVKVMCNKCIYPYIMDPETGKCHKTANVKGCAIHKKGDPFSCFECFYEVNGNSKYFMASSDGKSCVLR